MEKYGSPHDKNQRLCARETGTSADSGVFLLHPVHLLARFLCAAILVVLGGTFSGALAAEKQIPAHTPLAEVNAGLERAMFNMAASALGLPGLSPREEENGPPSVFDRSTWQNSGAFNDGGLFGSGNARFSGMRDYSGSSTWGEDDELFNSVAQRGLSAGMGYVNQSLENALLGLMGKDSPYGNGKVRLGFHLNLNRGKTRLAGEGDVLWPLFDNPYTTVFTQMGLRTMSSGSGYGNDRLIGNFGLGQRWFPGATVKEDGSLDSGRWMFGYNVFYDHDFSRQHQRGGLGLEGQYDWIKLSANLYAPLSGWKDSRDFDGDYIQERAARGWDVRAKGYLPFYRQMALTGSFSQWLGQNVGMFGPSRLEKNPRVWSYGVEYTPVPAITAYVNQRQSERGRGATDFGLRFTWHFGMDAAAQLAASKVEGLRTVQGGRHDFVDRENKIILEYKDKGNYRVEYLGLAGENSFRFRVINGFGKGAAGEVVQVTAQGASFVAEAPAAAPGFLGSLVARAGDFLVRPAHASANMSYTTNNNGEFTVRLSHVEYVPVLLTISAGNATHTMYMRDATLSVSLEAEKSSILNKEVIAVTLETSFPKGTKVDWEIEGPGTLTYGHTIGDNGKAVATLEGNAQGTGLITVTARVNGKSYTCTIQLTDVLFTLSADPNTIGKNEIARLTLKSTLPAGTKVSWSVDKAQLGSLSRQTDIDSQGQATADLTAGSATGKVTVTAKADKFTATAEISVSDFIYSLDQQSGDDLYEGVEGELTFVLMRNGAPMPNTGIKLRATGMDIISPSSVTTNSAGEFTAKLKGRQVGEAMLIASLGDVDIELVRSVLPELVLDFYAEPVFSLYTSSYDVTIEIKRRGLPLADGTVQLAFAGPGAFDNPPQSAPVMSGGIDLTLKPKTAGKVEFTLTVDGKSVSSPMWVQDGLYFLAGKSDNPQVYDGYAGKLTFTLEKDGMPVANTSLTLSAEGMSLGSGKATTNAQGEFSVQLTGKSLGTGWLRVEGANGLMASVNVEVWEALTIKEAKSYLAVGKPETVEFYLTLAGQKLKSGTMVSFSTDDADVLGVPPAPVRAADGTVKLALTPKKAGSVMLTASAEGFSAYCDMTVQEGSYTLEPDPANPAVSTGKEYSLKFTLRGDNGQPVADTLIELGGSSLDVSPESVKTGKNGTFTIDVSATEMGEATLRAELPSGAVAQYRLPVSAGLALSSFTPYVQVGGETAFDVEARWGGKPLADNTTVQLTYSNGDLLDNPPSSAKVQNNGIIMLLLKGKKAGQGELTVTVNGKSASLSFRVQDGDYFLKEVPGNPVVYAGIQGTVQFILLKDGNPLPNTNITLSSGDAGMSLSPAAIKTDVNGNFSVKVTADSEGWFPFTAETASGRAEGYIVVLGQLGLTSTKSSLVAGKAEQVEFTLTMAGTPLAKGTKVTFTSSAPEILEVSPQAVTLGTGGRVSLTLTPHDVGEVELVASVGGLSSSHTLYVQDGVYTIVPAPDNPPLYTGVMTKLKFTLMKDGKAAGVQEINADCDPMASMNVTSPTDRFGRFTVELVGPQAQSVAFWLTAPTVTEKVSVPVKSGLPLP